METNNDIPDTSTKDENLEIGMKTTEETEEMESSNGENNPAQNEHLQTVDDTNSTEATDDSTSVKSDEDTNSNKNRNITELSDVEMDDVSSNNQPQTTSDDIQITDTLNLGTNIAKAISEGISTDQQKNSPIKENIIDTHMETISTDMETISLDTGIITDAETLPADLQSSASNKDSDLKGQDGKQIECMNVDESLYNQCIQENIETDPIASVLMHDNSTDVSISVTQETDTETLSTQENTDRDIATKTSSLQVDSTSDSTQENIEDPIGSISQETSSKELITSDCVQEIVDQDPMSCDLDESILPDAGKVSEETKETEVEYIVTKSTEKTEYECMQCNKQEIPKYACSFNDNSSYICNEDCLKDLKEKNPGKVVVRDLRVKVFASEDLSRNVKESILEQSNAQDLFACKVCNKDVKKKTYFSWNTMNFCSEQCLNAFQKTRGTTCVECNTDVPENVMGKYSVRFGTDMKQFCKNSCLLDHKKKQRFCSLCQGQLTKNNSGRYCSKMCNSLHSNTMPEKSTGLCAVCLTEKTMEIEYLDGDKKISFCGDPCFVAYKFVNNINPLQCEFCKKCANNPTQTFSFSFENTEYYLCSKECQKLFIITSRKIVHCMWCNVKKYNFDMVQVTKDDMFITVCSLSCYKSHKNYVREKLCHQCKKEIEPLYHLKMLDGEVTNFCSPLCLNLFKDTLPSGTTTEMQIQHTVSQGTATNEGVDETSILAKRQVKKFIVIKPRMIPNQRNISTMCKPYQITKAVTCKPKDVSKSCQTEAFNNKLFVPIPVPIYVPLPVHMYNMPVPCPFPFPIPIPVPIFIPTCRKSIAGIQKEINKIKAKVPADPLEAEVLMMAEMVAEDKKPETDSDSETEQPETVPKEESFDAEPEQLDTNNTFGEDVLQMALKMASDFEEPVDLEGAVAATTIAVQGGDDSSQRIGTIMDSKRRSIRQARQSKKKQVFSTTPPQQAVELEKPDANMSLKYTFGVNAWKQWVSTKNIELQKSSIKAKLFKTEILQLSSDELNFSLCLFVKEVRKPNGSEYAPDTIYYLCLGIQQFLYENGRIDNIFCDAFYDKFTDCLNEVCRKFSVLYNESQYIVTRVEEEHLWESKQLGAHSPLVLLNTLMFFNTKHFSLTTVDDHLQLSFSHIMKHWKRNPNQPGARNVLLRFYPPQTSYGTRKKKVYEQQENEDNPLRCPVKLYEFYLSKCPESVKTRNDVFYLQPERSCVPDSPVWYSTIALSKEPLEKMLSRIKMVKEINVALLTT